ncbi:MAG: GAF domain-containing SpoIIE family protein phosphatase [bacterium]
MGTASPKHRSNRSQLKRLEALIDASRILNSTLNLEKLLSLILDLATSNLKATRGTIYLVDEERDELWSKVVKGRELIEIRLPLGTGIAGHVGKTGVKVNLKDAWKDKRFYSGFDLRSGFQTKTMLCMPMRDRNEKIIGVFQILNKVRGTFTREDEHFLEAFSVHVALAIENARLHESEVEKKKMEREIEIAGSIQRRLLPKEIPLIPNYDIAAITKPSKMVGGDYYDVIKLSETKSLFLVADVSGKGIPAALLVSTVHAYIHAYLGQIEELDNLGKGLNTFVYEHTEAERFITLIAGILDVETGMFNYLNAGHNYPYLYRYKTHAVETLAGGGIPLGMFDFAEYQNLQVQLEPSDILVLYSDGVTEAMNPAKDQYSEERLMEQLKTLASEGSERVKSGIVEDVERFVSHEPPSDDLTLVIIKRNE